MLFCGRSRQRPFRRDKSILPLPDLPSVVVGFIEIAVFAAVADQVFQQRLFILLVEQRKSGFIPERFMFLAQYVQPKGMESRDSQSAYFLVVQ